MSRPPSIFISYRRSDSEYVADRIFERLKRDFGEGSVFFDIDTIPLGRDFREFIDQAVGQCQVAVVIIGKTWVNVTDASGQPRLQSETDLVRLEVESALQGNISVIPVLVGGASIPQPNELPDSLGSLSYCHGINVRSGRDFHNDVDSLVEGIRSLLQENPTKAAKTASRSSSDEVVDRLLGATSEAVSKTGRYSLQSFSFEVVTVDAQGYETGRRQETAEHFLENLGDGVLLDMVRIPGGRFLLGSSEDEPNMETRESPQHSVTISEFFMGRYPVTQDQWKVIASLDFVNHDLKPSPSKYSGDKHPVEGVHWEDAVEFCARLSDLVCFDYRLSSEAEWEYACRAGTTTPFHFGEVLTPVLANYDRNHRYRSGPIGQNKSGTTEVGQFPPNHFGLCDMHGNVLEWCQDSWHPNYSEAPSDGSVWQGSSKNHVLRGGSWINVPHNCRSARRDFDSFFNTFNRVGFRVVCAFPRF